MGVDRGRWSVVGGNWIWRMLVAGCGAADACPRKAVDMAPTLRILMWSKGRSFSRGVPGVFWSCAGKRTWSFFLTHGFFKRPSNPALPRSPLGTSRGCAGKRIVRVFSWFSLVERTSSRPETCGRLGRKHRWHSPRIVCSDRLIVGRLTIEGPREKSAHRDLIFF